MQLQHTSSRFSASNSKIVSAEPLAAGLEEIHLIEYKMKTNIHSAAVSGIYETPEEMRQAKVPIT